MKHYNIGINDKKAKETRDNSSSSKEDEDEGKGTATRSSVGGSQMPLRHVTIHSTRWRLLPGVCVS